MNFRGIQQPCGVSLENACDLVAHASEDGHLLFLRAGGVGGIVEAPVVAVHLAGEDRAGLIRISTDGDDGPHLVR